MFRGLLSILHISLYLLTAFLNLTLLIDERLCFPLRFLEVTSPGRVGSSGYAASPLADSLDAEEEDEVDVSFHFRESCVEYISHLKDLHIHLFPVRCAIRSCA